jgi:hypothetical protein
MDGRRFSSSVQRAARVAAVASLALVPWTRGAPGTPAGPAVGSASSSLAFRPAAQGEFQFDTGVLRGKLRAGGKSFGLSSVIHVPSGLPLDRSFGLLSHYRVFTAKNRYGAGAWDWLSEARLLSDGAVEVRWPAATERPFEMLAVYRLSGPATVDLETTVKAQTRLSRFEVFLASYFNGAFSNAFVCVKDHAGNPGGRGFLAADKTFGEWQIYPRDRTALDMITDGRWAIQPDPVEWTIMPWLARPIGVRREPRTGLTAVLMASAQDCFAVATPHQTEGHYSLYLSLFGRDFKAGETIRTQVRLMIEPSLSEQQILGRFKEYVLRGKP